MRQLKVDLLQKKVTKSPTSHSKRKKKSSSAKDSNLRQPPASTHVVAGIHKETLQASRDPTSLEVSIEERANPQLISVVSASTTKPIFFDSTILHFESASGHEASAASAAKADPKISAPNDLVSKQQGIVKGTKKCSFNYIIADTNPHVLVDKTKSASEGLETVLTEPTTQKDASNAEREVSFGDDEFNTYPNMSSSDDTKKKLKLEDLSKLILNVEVYFIDMDSPKDDEPIIVQDEDEEEVHDEKVHAEQHKETKDASTSQPPSPKTGKIQELSTQVHLLQTLNSKLVKEKEVAKTEAALLKAKPSFPNVEQLTKLLVKSLTPELSKLLSSHDLSNLLPTELKELPFKFKDISWEIKELKKYVHELEIELLGI
ncbi:hypothetical protein Tco_0260104 [Tanacetum coccineum]